MKRMMDASGPEGTSSATGHVAVMLDFENLVYGLRDLFGEDRIAEMLDLEHLFALAGEYGPVASARAYADWRWKEINQHQVMLYRSGVDLVHVFGRMNSAGSKNSADVQMATDAVEAIWTLPHVRTFVIVSGDRDFLPVLKTLRRYGKTVVGVAPDGAASSTLASLCDRFLQWSALAATYGETAEPPAAESGELAMVKRTIAQLLGARNDDGMKGAQLRPLLRQHHPTFDESQFGFRSLSAFLASIPDVVRIERIDGPGDLTLWPASAVQAPPTTSAVQLIAVRRAGLSDYRFEPDASHRRLLLEKMFAAIRNSLAADGTFAWQDVVDRMASPDTPTLTTTTLSKYFMLLLKGRCFEMQADDPAPMRTRRMRLAADVVDLAAFVLRYEASACWKLQESQQLDLEPEAVHGLLGITASEKPHVDLVLARIATQRAAPRPDTRAAVN